MAILKKDYELSVWDETLGEKGSKKEKKMYIIGMNDMDHLGRATNLQLKEELKGTHTLTFQMPSKYFDSKVGDFVHNELSDALFNEKKLKLKFKNDWYEFYVKKVTESKQHKSIMYNFECTDAFIDELSRNGYGITFDTELYNNVEELGVFNEEILEDSIWQYDATKNIGDFTEYSEEKLFKIPIAFFGGSLQAYKLKYQIDDIDDETGEYLYQLKNVYTGEKRLLEMGDDYARELEYFWDNGDFDHGFALTETKVDVENDGYIYVPYSCLDFTYINTNEDTETAATEEAQSFTINDITSYGIVPTTIDPSSLIQFIAIPKGAEVQIDEDGLLVDKDYTYVMTVDDWNENIATKYWYQVEKKEMQGQYWDTDGNCHYPEKDRPTGAEQIFYLGVATYDGYLDNINDVEVTFGKKISITDRTEINISEDIDQYVTVYQNNASEFEDEYTNPDEWNTTLDYDNYRVCSYKDTRTIVPQLATNLVCNGSEMTDTDGWAVMQVPSTAYATSGEIEVNVVTTTTTTGTNDLTDYTVDTTNGLKFIANARAYDAAGTDKTLNYFYPTSVGNTNDYPNTRSDDDNMNYHTFVNFGITGQEEDLVQGQTYLLYIDAETDDEVLNSYTTSSDDTSSSTTSTSTTGSALKFCTLSIGSGDYTSSGNYQIDDNGKICFNFGSADGAPDYIKNLYNSSGSKNKKDENIELEFGKYYFVRLTKDITNPYFCITLYPYQDQDDNNIQYNTLYIKKVIFSKAYTCGIDFFDKDTSANEDKDPYIKGYYKYTGRDIFFNKDATMGDKIWSETADYNTGESQKIYYREAFVTSEKDEDGNSMEVREFILDTDVIAGDTYGYQRYFIQQLTDSDETDSTEFIKAKDTFKLKSYLNADNETNGLDPAKYTEDDYQVVTNFIDLYQCPCYDANAAADKCDCAFSGYDDKGNLKISKENSVLSPERLCLYQKYGYCPYRFKTEKHCRRIRTLTGEKSNRFNLTQELSKVFEVYPVYYIEHEDTGKIVTDPIDDDDNLLTLENGVYYKDGEEFTGTVYNRMRKKVFYMTEKGMENKLGFRYEKNLSNISRTLDSNSIVTKLYVEDVDSDLSDTGLCSIKTAEDNPSKDNYIIDFSYYTMKGMLDSDMVEKDLYGKKGTDDEIGYLKRLGYYNEEYDKLSNKIINLQDESYTELEANVEVNLTGIETAQKELNKIIKTMSSYSVNALNSSDSDYTESDTYKSYVVKKDEQTNTLIGLIESTFFTDGYAFIIDSENGGFKKDEDGNYCVGNEETSVGKEADGTEIFWTPSNFMKYIDKYMEGFKKFKEKYLDTFKYTTYGMMGQYVGEYKQIKTWKKERAVYLAAANKISLRFFQKYEPYLKEGTWSDSNYLSDNTYYFGAKEVAKEGAIPKVTYDITVSDIDILDRDGDYLFNIADTTYVEDIETFGINQKTGLPNRLKVIISSITYDLDSPSKNVIGIQNYTSQFEDLFEQISASVQSLSFNENTYKRSSNFTATKNVESESLQGTLDENQLTLVETDESNIEIDYTGQSGSDINNHSNQYKLDGQGLFFSNDGGQTWAVGVTPKGINADYINVGTLDATKIQIVDGNYLYFLWDNSGITAYRNPAATAAATGSKTTSYLSDFARFNKYGLSLVEDGKIRLRAGYEFNGETDVTKDKAGDANSETEIKKGGGIGFYLYNTAGQAIFKTETKSDLSSDNSSDIDIDNETARISLVGEMFVTNTITSGASTTSSSAYTYYNKLNLSNIYVYKLSSRLSDGTIEEESASSLIKWCLENYYTKDEDDDTNYLNYSKNFSGYTLTVKQVDFTSEKIVVTGVSTNDTNSNIYTTLYTSRWSWEWETDIGSSSSFTQKYIIYDGHCYEVIKSGGSPVYCLSSFSENSSTNTNQDKAFSFLSCWVLQEDKTSDEDPYAIYWSSYICYEINSSYYKDKKSNSSDSETDTDSSSGQVALYINNKEAWNETETQNKQHRLFFCGITNDENQINNIFSILKGGDLYMGGKVKVGSDDNKKYASAEDLSKLDAEIYIDESYLKLVDGKMIINFDQIEDENGLKLTDYVGEASTGIHRHKISSLKFKYSDECDNYLYWPSKTQQASMTDASVQGNPWYYSFFQNSYVSKDEIRSFLNYIIRGSIPSMSSWEKPNGKIAISSDDDDLIYITCEDSYTDKAGSATTSYSSSNSTSFSYYGLNDIF